MHLNAVEGPSFMHLRTVDCVIAMDEYVKMNFCLFYSLHFF